MNTDLLHNQTGTRPTKRMQSEPSASSCCTHRGSVPCTSSCRHFFCALPTALACTTKNVCIFVFTACTHGVKTNQCGQNVHTCHLLDPMAKCLHYVCTACILCTQRLGYSPKNTCHLFTRGKTERCQYHRVGQVSIDTSGCSYNQQHRPRRTVRSWCRLATIKYRRSRAFERR